ncbi:maltose ABC transporter [Clostridium fallax]|uniref:Carbohydrate ABC transporter membrane protein 2, CUT1 family n=1 Tax=Clostridium fallax TaxID=1533 RepID=A0A1M4XAR3_9CLOT|nr:sugar ABC transporter permease [Clostridium fallax]SHE90628.1 carbohydrate ABC transporter membrane protein 2, CUT1 family [Clostridium fallax]SQB06001.1 maltose ABC transporter [Clostridium fallax]
MQAIQAKINKKAFKSSGEYKKKLSPADKRNLWFGRIFIWIMIVLTIFPVIAVVSASMAKGQAFNQTTLFPKEWTLDNYVKVLTETDFLIWLKNSLILCTCVSVIQLLLTLPASFAFSKLKFRGRKSGLMFLLILQMFPTMMALPAILGIAYRLEAMDNMFALILILCGGSAYNIWLLKGYMDGVPNDLMEAAYVDGATTWQVFTRITVPLTRNMLIVIFLFTFIGTYSEFVFTSALMKAPENQTIATGLKSFITNNFSANWTQYSAAAIMASFPLVILFVCSQKYIAEGLVAGSVKG